MDRQPIAPAEEILRYMGEVIDENGHARHIRYRHRIASASWSSLDNVWAIDAVRLTPANLPVSPAIFFS